MSPHGFGSIFSSTRSPGRWRTSTPARRRTAATRRMPLAACGHFPITVVEMISVAEESNTLDTVLVEIANGLERRTQRRLELMVRLIEPVMLLLLASVVLVVVLALLMPVIKMSAAV